MGKRNIEFREEREKPQLPHERGEVVEVERYGQTLAAVGEVDPGAGLDFIGRLLKAVSDAGLSPVGDERLAWAIRKSEETTRGQHGAGLLLKRVPVVLATKARAEERARVAQVAEASRVASEAWIWREEMRALAEDPLAAEEDRMLARKALGA